MCCQSAGWPEAGRHPDTRQTYACHDGEAHYDAAYVAKDGVTQHVCVACMGEEGWGQQRNIADAPKVAGRQRWCELTFDANCDRQADMLQRNLEKRAPVLMMGLQLCASCATAALPHDNHMTTCTQSPDSGPEGLQRAAARSDLCIKKRAAFIDKNALFTPSSLIFPPLSPPLSLSMALLTV